MNWFRTIFLISFLSMFFVLIGYLLGGQAGMLIALLVALLMNVFAYYNSDKLVLRFYSSSEVSQGSAPELYEVVRLYSARASIPMPRIYIIDSEQPNAFATGRNPANGVVALTRGLLLNLEREEIEGVIAHELAHIRNYDTLTMTIASVIASAVTFMANFALFFGGSRDSEGNQIGLLGSILLMFLAPLAASIIQLAISRTREYAADRYASEITRNPLALASALRRIENLVRGGKIASFKAAEKHPATANMFIINPLTRAGDKLFATHPATQNRIRELEKIAHHMGL